MKSSYPQLQRGDWLAGEVKATAGFKPPVVSTSNNCIWITYKVAALPADQVTEATHHITFAKSALERIWCFLGVNQGALGEFAIDVTGPATIYRRSYHKESVTSYEAWDAKDLYSTTDHLDIHVLGHPTGSPTNIQFGLILETVL